MKVLDPQAALLTTSEVYNFLLENPARPPPKKIGSYTPVNLKGYQRVREDFLDYITNTIPYIAGYPPPETFIHTLVPKLRTFGLSKTEAFMMVNLGVGLARGYEQQPSANGGRDGDMKAVSGTAESTSGNENAGTSGDEEQHEPVGEGDEAAYQPSDMELLSCVIEEFEDRFPGDEGQEQIQKIVQLIRDEYQSAQTKHAATNGDALGKGDIMDVS
ncbi:hypothetical protein G647_02406 [Cladophialophora carrionii CBS 160.54]|uniref:Uncharacterized protein n=1 Tax=Cladophialophora carrionii CBS 160.54 TaxID=1279043 RepID=V9DI49_9EURO|nr:uncharacterized protein G647_02406 [Cladophialophora carrionii CBS 160.54]ETI25632.1 hypothetical protein G647_02406 [Cladophialophora carrionii CBS 160.54]